MRPGETVAVLGIGGLGHLGVQFASKMGFRTIAIARGKDKEALARELGAHHYLDSQAGDVSAALQKLGGAKIILATAIVVISSGALAQQALTGSVTRIDEANGKITIQLAQSGTVGTSTAAAEDFKVQDGLLFNAVKPGDKVAFTATEAGGVKTITKLEKQ